MIFKVGYTPTALKMLNKIKEPDCIRIKNRIRDLKNGPEKQGMPLLADLKGYRSIHVADRYKAVYRVQRSKVTVVAVGIGVRKECDRRDVYELVKKLLRLVS